MSIEDNKQAVRSFIEEVFNAEPQSAQKFAAQDYVAHDPSGKVMQGMAHNMAGFRSAFPDLHVTITQLLGEGDLVAAQWTASGTHQQPMTHLTVEFARPATGKSATVTGISLFRFEGDKIAEMWNHWDTHHLLGQIASPQNP
ncbi:MAG TPA: ester cyclase [Ktedonosporobacter sp.]|nr:ester cyclase [Ktedonosporobacter sp.]